MSSHHSRKTPDDGAAALLAALDMHLPHGALAVIPEVAGMDWARIATDVSQPLVFTNRPSDAYRLCSQGQPAIAVTGISKGWLAKWLRQRGAQVRGKAGAH